VGSNRPIRGQRADEPVDIYFPGTELTKVVEAIGAMTGRNFFFDPQIGSVPITLIAHEPIEPEMLLPLLQSILVTHGFTMREDLDSKLIKIVPLGEESEKGELVIGSDDLPEGYDQILTHVVAVQYASAEELASLLPRFGSSLQGARVDAYGPTNTLILTDNAYGIRNMLRFLREIDIPGQEVSMEWFTLDYARAEVVASQLTDALLGGGDGAPEQAQRRAVRARPPVRPRAAVPGQGNQTIVGSEEPTLRIVADERLNMLVVLASEALMSDVRQLVELFDTPTPPDLNAMHVYQLLNADAETVKEKLNVIVGGASPAAGATNRRGRGNAPQPAGGVSAELQPFEKSVIIESYEASNSLLIVASPQDYMVIKDLIQQLDIPQRQVHVEAMILEVVIQDRFELSTELAALSGEDGFALNNVITLANVLSNGPLGAVGAADSPVLTAGVLDGVVEIPVPGDDGLTLQPVPKIPLLLTALDSLTDLDVLSEPMLTTVDNEEAMITIGQEVPVTTGTRTSLDQSAVGSSVYSNIERRDVGIKMNVTPQISEGDYVFLDLQVEVSQTVQSDIGADPNIVGPTFQKSEVTNKVVIRDGSTGIVGGLISETTDHSTRQAPYLGDVPVLGWLFKQKRDRRAKRNLVVLVTPHIVKEGVDSDRITQRRIEEFSRANLDVMFEGGFIKKMKRRHELRTDYRPGRERLRELQQGEQFGPGVN
jgi:general secretion pathway protein D